MKFLITRTSDTAMQSEESPAPGAVRSPDKKSWHIEIASLEVLAQLIDTLEEPLILSRRQAGDALTSIEIYDDMREQYL